MGLTAIESANLMFHSEVAKYLKEKGTKK